MLFIIGKYINIDRSLDDDFLIKAFRRTQLHPIFETMVAMLVITLHFIFYLSTINKDVISWQLQS
jgi:hypothetical protein